MRYACLGRSGLKVSRLGIGTMTFGRQVDEAVAHAILDRAVAAGVNLIDTADVYPSGMPEDIGRSEEIVGRWLAGRRHEVVLATKGGMRTGPGVNDFGSSRRHITAAVHASLRRLGTDTIDLYQLHDLDPTTPIEETLRALDDLVRAGEVRYIGCSNFPAWQTMKALWTSDRRNLVRFDAVQPRYNLLAREAERELFPLCLDQGVGVLVYNPLAGGLLTGKHPRIAPLPGSRLALSDIYRERYWSARNLNAVEQVIALATARDMQPATFAVAWTLANPAVTTALVGATRPEQLDATLAAADLVLDSETLAACDAVARDMGIIYGPFER